VKTTAAALLALASAGGVNVVSYFTLRHNLSLGVYPIDADSIGLPLADGVVVSIVILVCLLTAVRVPKRGVWTVSLGMMLAILGGLIASLMAFSWADSRHYPIAIAYLPLAALCATIVVDRIRILASNKLLQATRETRAPEQ
jgi:hypothetical protein